MMDIHLQLSDYHIDICSNEEVKHFIRIVTMGDGFSQWIPGMENPVSGCHYPKKKPSLGKT